MWCGCSSLPKEARQGKDRNDPLDPKTAAPSSNVKAASHSGKTARSPVPRSSDVVIPKQAEVESKKTDADAAVHTRLKECLSGMWTADWHASESLEPILILQGLPFFKRKAILAQGLPSLVIEFNTDADTNTDTVTLTSIRGPKMDKTTAPIILEEKPKTPSSIVAICEEDDVKESVKASFTDLPKSLTSPSRNRMAGGCKLFEKCLKIDHRFLNGDRKVEYHAVQFIDEKDKDKDKDKEKRKSKRVKKFTTSHFCNRTLGKEASATVVSYKEEVSAKSQKESQPEEELAQGQAPIEKNCSSSGSSSASSSAAGEAPTGESQGQGQGAIQTGAESLKTGIGMVGAATVGAVVATDQVVTPKVTAWLLPPLKKKEVAQIEAQQKQQAPAENMLKLSSSTTGLDDLASWLTPSMQQTTTRKGDNQLETNSVYSQQSRVSESYLVNPFTGNKSEQGDGRKTTRSKSARAARKQKTGIMMEARAMSLLFPFNGTDDSPRSVKENDGIYTFRDDDDEEFKRVQSQSFQLLEQFKGK